MKFLMPLHEDIFIQFNYQDAVTKRYLSKPFGNLNMTSQYQHRHWNRHCHRHRKKFIFAFRFFLKKWNINVPFCP